MTKHEAAQAYLSLPVNFGSNSNATRTAEYDAFIAGWEACKEKALNIVEVWT